jgi:hypothetical protein
MLTVEQMNQICYEITLGKPEQLHTPEANAFREKMRVQIEEIARQGLVADLPAD